MRLNKESAVYDLMLRASGIVLAIVGAFALRHLHHLVHLPPKHEATVVEMGFAAIGFLGLSFGSGLLWLGAHIHDQVPISARWARGASISDASLSLIHDAAHLSPSRAHDLNIPTRVRGEQ
ncbi:hypothetical protein [Sphingomonas aquatilis]|uniref:hypothetical protein n=1 Tax=Sphingomonas aquatilis TaxID=93063 RepID=UPI0023F8B429|nr:hypothetical protein [Sphingomonas aquatilis]MCI4655109.1 hypothetical protein [Sphingomonas aquatilis]